MSVRENQPPIAPPALGVDGRILEGIVTTLNADGAAHISPMGPIVNDSMDWLWLRPFRTTMTFQNLDRTACGVFHVTDDVELIAQSAVGELDTMPAVVPAERINGAILADACRWYAFEVEWIDASTERTTMLARVVDRGVLREFFGFNRAKHAVLEAAILATRVHLTGVHAVLAEFDRLAVAIDKTGAAAEHRAMKFLRSYVEQAAKQP